MMTRLLGLGIFVFLLSGCGISSPKTPEQILAEKGKKIYQLWCASCHGEKGKGDGGTAAALQPKPRDHTDGVWQSSVSDEDIKKIVRDGGEATGLSPLMGSFRHLGDEKIDMLVAYIRSLRSN